VVRCFSSDVRNYLPEVEPQINDKNFESTYIQGGINSKPSVVEGFEKDVEKVHRELGEVAVEIDRGVKGVNGDASGVAGIKTRKGEESEIEKEAWRLLQNAVVTYCNSPIGTVAANDPNDKQPLNYDQVFIRDFVPSALAFLMKGEGEIVRNFLLYTLQLQVTIILNPVIFSSCPLVDLC